MRDVAAWVLLGAGAAIELLSVLGVVLLRDPYDRLHYVGAGIVAALLVGAAIVVRESFSLIGIRTILLAAFLLFTGPVLTHVTARALRLSAEEEDAG